MHFAWTASKHASFCHGVGSAASRYVIHCLSKRLFTSYVQCGVGCCFMRIGSACNLSQDRVVWHRLPCPRSSLRQSLRFVANVDMVIGLYVASCWCVVLVVCFSSCVLLPMCCLFDVYPDDLCIGYCVLLVVRVRLQLLHDLRLFCVCWCRKMLKT